MQKLLSVLCLAMLCLTAYAQVNTEVAVTIDLAAIDKMQAEKGDKLESAFTVMRAVRDAGAYIESLTELFRNGEISLPVGIKQGEYELIIQRMSYDTETDKITIYASCAFKFKDNGQPIAFEGEAVIDGLGGLGSSGTLTLITPVRRDLGKAATIVICEGTKLNFDCKGVESFDAKLAFFVTSPTIIAVNSTGVPTNKPLAFGFETKFYDFDNYTLSLNINQTFAIKGLKDFLFTLRGATLDQSDVETSDMMKVPDNYFATTDEAERNLWKGLAIKEASVTLPAIFKKPGNNERLTVALQQVLFDNNGFSGNVAVQDLVSSDSIKRDQWALSLTGFSLGFLKNNVVAFGLGGDINIPPFGNHSLLPYEAFFNLAKDDYEFKVGIAGKYDFPALQSTLTLNELSRIEILFQDSDIYPSIHASGILNIHAQIGSDTTKRLSIPDISFEDMVISRAAPHLQIGAIGITGNLTMPKVAGFGLGLKDIQTFNSSKGSGLRFDAEIAINDMFSGTAGIQLYGDYAKWKFKEVGIDKVHVEFKSSAFSLEGGVWFKNGDKLYGDGFRGDIKLSLVEKFNFDAVGVFGKVDDYRYFLADVMMDVTPGIPVPPMLSFMGFGGGLYRHMQQTSKLKEPISPEGTDFGKSLSGINYVPDRKVGLGVMASAKFGLLGAESTLNGRVGFEMQFNQYGGLNFLQLRGEVSLMQTADILGSMKDNIAKEFTAIESKGGTATNAQKAIKADLEGQKPDLMNQGALLAASINLDFDFINKAFTADLNTYLDAWIIKGVGQNNCMGWASAHFSPQKWYVHIGTPSNRVGVSVLNLSEVNAYFMLGDDIPGLPMPPNNVLKNLSSSVVQKLQRSSTEKLMSGKGIAFGAGLNLNFDASLMPFYAHFNLGLGAEFMLADLNGKTCKGISGVPGINGWYAQAQAWAFVEANIGIEFRLFMKTRRFDILDISAGALLQGGGPNPMYFMGAAGGRFSIMGGLISGKCSFDFSVGEKCVPVGGSPFGEDVIAGLTPAAGSKDINVFATPQVLFNVPVNVAMTIDEDNGEQNTYMATLETFTIKYKDSGQEVVAKSKFDTDGKVCAMKLDEPFESQKEVEIAAKVGFKKRVNNNWEYVNGDDGNPMFEEKTVAFHTGNRPKEILPEHVKYSYPVNRQYNYYPNEYKQGYILVSENYSYLFSTEKPEGMDQVVRVSDANGKKYNQPFTYRTNSSDNGIRLEIDFSMENTTFENDHIYKLAVVNVPQAKDVSITSNIRTETTTIAGQDSLSLNKQHATGTLVQADETEIYALDFKTSTFNTFAEKIKKMDNKNEGWRSYIEPFVHNIGTNLRESELFDKYEIYGTDGTNRLVQFEAQLDRTKWYTQSFYPDMYRSQSATGIEKNRSELNAQQDYGTPPAKAVYVQMPNREKSLSDDEVSVGIATGYHMPGLFVYSLPFWCARDFYYSKHIIAKRYQEQRHSLTSQDVAILNTNFPPVVAQGDYPVKITYTLPGRKITTSAVEMTMYNPLQP